MVTKFQKFLEKNDLSESTVRSYVWTVNYFTAQYEKIDKENLLAYKGYLVEHFKPQTVNLRLQALNKYLEFINKDKLKLKFIKIQQKSFLENVVSNADYKFLKSKLKKMDILNGISLFGFLVHRCSCKRTAPNQSRTC